MAYEPFEVYLNDHLAGATAGVNVAQQAAERHRSTELGPFYAEIASEIKRTAILRAPLQGASPRHRRARR